LKCFGAEVIDADKLGHRAYDTGSACYYKLIEAFGEGIVSDDESKSINRRALGDIVFRDPSQMKLLQDIVWPEIRKLIIESLSQLKSSGKDRVVIEAAVRYFPSTFRYLS
jgi:dephospho-CoA kinase